MKIKIRYFIISLVALLLLVLLVVCVYFLLGVPRVFSINSDFDLNSGDERVQIYACFLKIKDEIKTTPFSQEVRRLGIDVPKDRKWVRTYTKLLINKHINYAYGGIPAGCNFLIKMFDDRNVSDENRRIILQRIITILQSGDRNVPRMIEDELPAIAEKVYKVGK